MGTVSPNGWGTLRSPAVLRGEGIRRITRFIRPKFRCSCGEVPNFDERWVENAIANMCRSVARARSRVEALQTAGINTASFRLRVTPLRF
jgi:hypothetical protein